MGGGSSTQPIVFVFGAEKGDADGRKKNLSAINTQVAYRAHERRREKKSKQKAQGKEYEQVDQPLGVKVDPSGGSSHIIQPPNLQRQNSQHPTVTLLGNGHTVTTFPTTDGTLLKDSVVHKSPRNHRQESDLLSDISSSVSAVWPRRPSSSQHSSPVTELTALSPVGPGPLNGYFNTTLDPFFRLPTAASDRDRWLVHFYLREMGHIGFGTHQNALFCPDRDWVSMYVSTKPLCFQWILIHAEEYLSRIGVLLDQAKTFERRTRAYNSLGAILNSRSIGRDEGISGIMFAAIVDTASTNVHLSAMDRLINDTGGLDAFLDTPLGIAHPEHVATVYAFGQCPIPDLDVLNAIKSRFLDNLRRLYDGARQEQDKKQRIHKRGFRDTVGRQVLDSNGVLVPTDHDGGFRYYIKSRQDCFTSDCLGPLLNTTLDTKSDYSSQARHLAALMQTMMILREFESSYMAKAMFLRRLKHVTDLSTARDPLTGQARLSHAGLLLINSFVRQEVQSYSDQTKTLLKGVRISKAIVDCLKIFPLLKLTTRSLIVSCLTDWLCYSDPFDDADFSHLSEKDLAMISAEISNHWAMGKGKIS